MALATTEQRPRNEGSGCEIRLGCHLVLSAIGSPKALQNAARSRHIALRTIVAYFRNPVCIKAQGPPANPVRCGCAAGLGFSQQHFAVNRAVDSEQQQGKYSSVQNK
jgi:hypothetical protein